MAKRQAKAKKCGRELATRLQKWAISQALDEIDRITFHTFLPENGGVPAQTRIIREALNLKPRTDAKIKAKA